MKTMAVLLLVATVSSAVFVCAIWLGMLWQEAEDALKT